MYMYCDSVLQLISFAFEYSFITLYGVQHVG